jgi:hypothetical protein
MVTECRSSQRTGKPFTWRRTAGKQISWNIRGKRVYVGKKRGGKRPLGLPGWNDKLVQEVLRAILEAYYEPQFANSPHGFRPGRGCHTAVETIRRTWKGTEWFIEIYVTRSDCTSSEFMRQFRR